MHKYKVTEKNIKDMAGRIRKFFHSCSECGMRDYSHNLSKINKEPFCYYTSLPNRKDNIYINMNHNEPVIIMKSPVNSLVHIGDVIRFIGGNRICIEERYHHSSKYYVFVRCYDRILEKSYDVIK